MGVSNGWERRKRVSFILILSVLSASLVMGITGVSTAYALAGDLDTSFGSGGTVTTTVDAAPDQGRGVGLLPDGRIVVVGSTPAAGSDFEVAIFNSNGSLDTSFSTDGKHNFELGGTDIAEAVTVIVESSLPRIIVAGSSDGELAAIKVRPESSDLDGDFGVAKTEGLVDALGHGVAVNPTDNSIFIAGSTTSSVTGKDFAIAKFTSSGQPDTLWGGTGVVITNNPLNVKDDEAFGITLQPTSSGFNVVAAGRTDNSPPLPGTDLNVAVARYTSSGLPDATFSDDGWTESFSAAGSSEDGAFDVKIQPSADGSLPGKIVVAGYTQPTSSPRTMFIVRYTDQGAEDSTFDDDGQQTIDVPPGTDAGRNSLARALDVDPNRKVVLAGASKVDAGSPFDFAVARLTPDGALDTLFSTDGKTTDSLSSSSDDAYDAVIQPDGKIVAAGEAGTSLGVARYFGDPVVFISGVSATEGDSGTKSFTFTVTTSATSSVAFSVDFSTGPGTGSFLATGCAGSDPDPQCDYITVTNEKVNFAAGQTSATHNVLVRGDTVGEFDETFEGVMSKGTTSGPASISPTRGTAIATILNDDPARITISDPSVAEGASGTVTEMLFTVTQVPYNPSGVTTTVQFATDDGTATIAGSDYQARSGTVEIGPGVTSVQVTATVVGDDTVEADEWFFMNLSNVGYNGSPSLTPIITDAQGKGTIVDDESSTNPRLLISDVTKLEGNTGTQTFDFVVTISASNASPVTVDFDTDDCEGSECGVTGTASVPADYDARHGTLTFPTGSGPRTQTVQVTVKGDTIKEFDEIFKLTLSNASTNADIQDSEGDGKILDDDGGGGPPPTPGCSPNTSFFSYNESFTGGVYVAAGDVNGDGCGDTITGPGPGGGPHVRVFSGQGGSELLGFFAYSSAFSGGVRVAAGDVDGDGFADVITGPGPGGGPHVRVFSGTSGAEIRSFFAYGSNFTGGIYVASGYIDGDDQADIITGADSGGGPHVRVFSGATGSEILGFFAYAPGFTGGVRVAAGDVNGDGTDEVITGPGPGGGPHVRAISSSGAEVRSFFAYSSSFSGGVYVASGYYNLDDFQDIITGAGPGGGPHVRVFNGSTLAELDGFFAYSPSFTGGVRVASGDVDGDGFDDVVTGPGPGGGPHVRAFT